MSQLDQVRQVFAANRRFYEAFESLDIRQMDQVWRPDDNVQCIHPGWPPLIGWPSVRDSWVRIFNNTRSMHFEISDHKITIHGRVAWVICLEAITTSIDETDQKTQVLATNIFVHGEDRPHGHDWSMVHHHGSPIFQRAAPPGESEP